MYLEKLKYAKNGQAHLPPEILDNLAKQAYKKVKRAKNETDRKSETDGHWQVDRQADG